MGANLDHNYEKAVFTFKYRIFGLSALDELCLFFTFEFFIFHLAHLVFIYS